MCLEFLMPFLIWVQRGWESVEEARICIQCTMKDRIAVMSNDLPEVSSRWV